MEFDCYFGIDFGTTNCAVYYAIRGEDGYYKEGKIGYDDNNEPVSSIVSINKKNGIIEVGNDIKRNFETYLEKSIVVKSIKSIIDSDITYTVNSKTISPVDIATELFKKLKHITDSKIKKLGFDKIFMTKAVVAIPVGMTASKRKKIRDAAENAGISIEFFISEPVAAFFANYERLKLYQNIAVFDWGGGTLDCCVLKNDNYIIHELSSNGLSCAGDDIDKRFANYLHSQICKIKNKIKSFDEVSAIARDKLINKSEEIKKNFFDKTEQNCIIPSYDDFGTINIKITYNDFVKAIDFELNNAMDVLKTSINESKAPLDAILLVGGSSNLLAIQEKIKESFDNKVDVINSDDKMFSIAQGAQKYSIRDEINVFVSNQDISLVLCDGSKFKLLSKGNYLDNFLIEENFGIVDAKGELNKETNEIVRLEFSGSEDIDKSDTKYKTIELPIYNFTEEYIKIIAIIDKDLVFRVYGCSSHKNNDYCRIWEYDKLKFSYNLPRIYRG